MDSHFDFASTAFWYQPFHSSQRGRLPGHRVGSKRSRHSGFYSRGFFSFNRRVWNDVPDLWMQSVFLEKIECVVMNAPEREEFDSMLFLFKDLLLESWNVLLSPVVSATANAALLKHRNTLDGASLLRIKRDNAASNKIVAVKYIRVL